MAEYRAYTIDNDGHIVDCQAMVCPNDTAAIKQAQPLVNGRPIELWSGERFIIKLEPKPEKGPPSLEGLSLILKQRPQHGES
jgi:hypothetical protein